MSENSMSHTVTLGSEDPGDNPLTVAVTVVSVQRREEPEIFGGTRLGLDAHVTIGLPGNAKPRSYRLSKLVGEQHWVVDAEFGPNGFPVHSNGFGARYLRVSAIAPEVAELVDAHAREAGLVEAIGPDVPLVLAGD